MVPCPILGFVDCIGGTREYSFVRWSQQVKHEKCKINWNYAYDVGYQPTHSLSGDFLHHVHFLDFSRDVENKSTFFENVTKSDDEISPNVYILSFARENILKWTNQNARLLLLHSLRHEFRPIRMLFWFWLGTSRECDIAEITDGGEREFAKRRMYDILPNIQPGVHLYIGTFRVRKTLFTWTTSEPDRAIAQHKIKVKITDYTINSTSRTTFIIIQTPRSTHFSSSVLFFARVDHCRLPKHWRTVAKKEISSENNFHVILSIQKTGVCSSMKTHLQARPAAHYHLSN